MAEELELGVMDCSATSQTVELGLLTNGTLEPTDSGDVFIWHSGCSTIATCIGDASVFA